jgi:hypothetical protein
MADDVFRNGALQQPAPNINNNMTTTTMDNKKNNEDNKMEEEQEDNVKLINHNSYVGPSTTGTVAATATTTTHSSYNDKECPPTPYTSNTTNDKHNSSSTGYLLKTPTQTPTDMVIDRPTSPQTYTPGSTPRRRFHSKKNTQANNTSNTPTAIVPPITPFVLGATELDMAPLQRAAIEAERTQSDYDDQLTQDNDHVTNFSDASMDTSDVSTLILKPKSIFNPYSKHHRSIVSTSMNTVEALPTTNKAITLSEPTAVQISNNTTNILIPTTYSTSTNEESNQHHTIQDPTIQELSQEDTKLIMQEIARHEQQQQWQEVKVKSPNRKHEPVLHQQKYIDPNPYSVLQEADTDNETKDSNNTNQPHNDSNEIEQINTPTLSINETSPQSGTITTVPTSSNRNSTPERSKQHSTATKLTKNPGRGGGARPHRSMLKTNKSNSAVPNDQQAEQMDVDEPTTTPTTTLTQPKEGDTTNQIPVQNGMSNIQTNVSSDKQNENSPPRRTLAIKHQHTYRILVKAYSTENERENFTRLRVLQIVLSALQKEDPVTSLVVPSDEHFQKRVYTTINLNSKNKTEYEKLENMLQFSSNTLIQGTIQITSNTIYSTIKKNLETKKMLQDTYQITLYRNNINANNLAEVGFFANHLVRHDTVECTRWITDIIPRNTPDFQSELITIWGGPPKERKGAGVLKIYSDRGNVNEISKVFQQHFNNPNHTRFIPKEYFDTLDPKQKAEYIESQYKYQRKYRSVIVKGIRNVHLPTVITDNNIPLSIAEWLKTVLDYQHRHMFFQVTEVNNDQLELRCLETNLSIAKKWARNATSHIARVLNPIQWESAFTDSNVNRYLGNDTEEWNPPPPPTIQFMPDPKDIWKKDIPKSITKQENKKQQNKRRNNNQSLDHDNDNNTTTTVNTQSSYTQETISELQNNSYQHQQLLDNHIRRFEAIDKQIEASKQQQHLVDEHDKRLVTHESEISTNRQQIQTLDNKWQEKFSSFSSNLATLEEEQQVQQRHQEKLTQDIASCSHQLPTITETMEQQQKQLIKYFRRQNKINAQTDKEIKKLKETQATHQTMISTLQAIVLQLQNSSPPTPLSQQRVRKRIKSRIQNDTSIQEDSDMESEENNNELHQLHAIATLQNNSFNQLSFIAHQTMDESNIEEELLTWDSDSTDNDESESNPGNLNTQEQNNSQDDPEHHNPGEDT